MTIDPKERLGVKNIDEIKSHAFFKGINWDNLMGTPAPFIPRGRDVDADYFPKASENDEELAVIMNDHK